MVETPCPCCNQPMQIEPHRSNTPWSLLDIAIIQRMRSNGIPRKVIGRLFGCSGPAIEAAALARGRAFVPRVTAMVEGRRVG